MMLKQFNTNPTVTVTFSSMDCCSYCERSLFPWENVFIILNECLRQTFDFFATTEKAMFLHNISILCYLGYFQFSVQLAILACSTFPCLLQKK